MQFDYYHQIAEVNKVTSVKLIYVHLCMLLSRECKH
jgi:hypothetical protein